MDIVTSVEIQSYFKPYVLQNITLTEFVNFCTSKNYDVLSLHNENVVIDETMLVARIIPKGLAAPIERICAIKP